MEKSVDISGYLLYILLFNRQRRLAQAWKTIEKHEAKNHETADPQHDWKHDMVFRGEQLIAYSIGRKDGGYTIDLRLTDQDPEGMEHDVRATNKNHQFERRSHGYCEI